MNILLTSVGRRNYIVDYFKDALREKGRIIVSNSIPDTSGMYVGDVSYVSPPIRSGEYIPFLLDICKKEEIRALIPLFDLDLSAIAFNKKQFLQAGIFPVVSDYDIISRCFDKLDYPDLLSEVKIKTPKTTNSISEALKLLEINEIQFPLIIKPRWGMGSVATIIVNSKPELVFEYDRLEFELAQTFLGFPVPEGNRNQLIIQELIKGEEFGMDVINDLYGGYIKTFCKKKLGMRSGETDGAVTIRNVELELTGEKIAKLLKHISILDVDIILTAASDVFVIDMNPRFGGGYPFTHLAGVDLPAAILSWLDGKEASDFLMMEPGVTSVKGITLIKKMY